jgi:hypothetical protein
VKLSVSFLLAVCAAVLRAEPSVGEINAACGVPLLVEESLWDENADEVAARLGWPPESRTSVDASFRLYPGEEARFLGARPYSQVLHAEEGRPAGISIVFANKGDSVDYQPESVDRHGRRGLQAELRETKKAIAQDEKIITTALTDLLGEPVRVRFGQGSATRENVLRWDWRGHTFLLSAPRGEYVALRILPSASADAGGRSRVASSVIRERAAARVERRPNGDVVLTDLPMVNQGPKGYCVPATWERVMRYMGIPADMYVLAMAGNTGAGGGTTGQDIIWGARSAVTAAGRRMSTPALRLEPEAVAKFIDRGVPVMWGMYGTDEMNAAVQARMQDRRQMQDPAVWSAALQPAREAADRWTKDPEAAHLCMITGYNEQTGELAFSDSYGPGFEERWITVEEARAISQDRFYVIEF